MDGAKAAGLTPDEKMVLHHLCRAWDAWCLLDRKHPDDDREFRTLIHQAQNAVAFRVAGRVDPEEWWPGADPPAR